MTAAAARRLTRRRAAVIAAAGAALAVAAVFAMASLIGQGAPATAPALVLALPAVAAPPAEPARVGSDGGLVVTAATTAAYAASPELPAAEPLAPAPDPALIEPGGLAGTGLPKIAADGRQPWQAYARPFDRRDGRARLVFIVLDVGLSRAASEAAIYRLPAAVTVAIDAYAAEPQQWAAAARRAGHEVLADLPLQAAPASGEDAGPRALLAAGDDVDNLQRAQAVLGRHAGYTGVLMRGGDGFADGFASLEPLLRDLRRRGLLLVDGVAAEGARLFRLGERAGLPGARLKKEKRTK